MDGEPRQCQLEVRRSRHLSFPFFRTRMAGGALSMMTWPPVYTSYFLAFPVPITEVSKKPADEKSAQPYQRFGSLKKRSVGYVKRRGRWFLRQDPHF